MSAIERLRRNMACDAPVAIDSATGRRGPRIAGRTAVLMLALGSGAIATTGVGYAYWQTTGSGSNSSTSGSISITIPTAPAAVTGLYPGATKAITITVRNPATSNSAVKLTGATAGTTSITAPGSVSTGTDCSAGSVSIDPASVTPQSATVAPGDTGTISANVKMDLNAGNKCQGATFSVPFTATAKVG